MKKLLILDKDGTLTKPASGGTFPQHPTDQVLLPGVAEAVAHYAQDGWTICIASNQGGCQVRKCKAIDLPSNVYLLHDGEILKIRYSRIPAKGYRHFHFYNRSKDQWQYVSYADEQIVYFQYKTLEDAIAEMRYCMELLPQIGFSLFCPDSGKSCWFVTDIAARDDSGNLKSNDKGLMPTNCYRKPDPGMLWCASNYTDIPVASTLFIGDFDTDRQCAENAGTSFLWAHDWLKPFI